MKLIVGLGNPGAEYALNRHNIGFILIDALNESFDGGPFRSEKKALISRLNIEGESVLLAKPQTYMNLSGGPTQALMQYYKIPTEDLLVLHDDLDTEFGCYRFQKNRGAGGNNGIKDIHAKLGTQDYARLKIGIGRPNGKQAPSDYVLKNFDDKQQDLLQDHLLNDLEDAVVAFVKKGYTYAGNHHNKRST
tara:strand:- start:1582 stop:2154 length:573 start_codon:yes stop_codon:yes gene_type:complete